MTDRERKILVVKSECSMDVFSIREDTIRYDNKHGAKDRYTGILSGVVCQPPSGRICMCKKSI